LNAKSKSGWTLLRRVALIVAAAANVLLFTVHQNRSAHGETAPARTQQSLARKPPRIDGLHDRHQKPGTAPQSGEEEKKLITVPVSLYKRFSIGGSWDLFDTESATLNASGKSTLGVDEATQNEVSRVLRSAADRLAAIQIPVPVLIISGQERLPQSPPSARL
jgi:hypothetical protein